MRYRANRPLRVTGQDGAVYSLLPGDEVPGFAQWEAAIRMAHLRQESVVDLEAGTRLSTEGGRLHLEVYGRLPEDRIDVPGPEVEPEVLVGSTLLPCPLCDHKGFSSKNSLAKHMGRKHAEG